MEPQQTQLSGALGPFSELCIVLGWASKQPGTLCELWAKHYPSPGGLRTKLTAWKGQSGCPEGSSSYSGPFFCLEQRGDAKTQSGGSGGSAPTPVQAPPSPSFLSILLIMRRRGSMYLDSCFSLSRYCCSSAWLEPAGLMTELGFTAGQSLVSTAQPIRPNSADPQGGVLCLRGVRVCSLLASETSRG